MGILEKISLEYTILQTYTNIKKFMNNNYI